MSCRSRSRYHSASVGSRRGLPVCASQLQKALAIPRACPERDVPRLLPDRLGALLGDDADLGERVAGVRLDLEPDLEARLGRPDRDHFGAGIAGDHAAAFLGQAHAAVYRKAAQISSPSSPRPRAARGPAQEGDLSRVFAETDVIVLGAGIVGVSARCTRRRGPRRDAGRSRRRGGVARPASATPASCRARRSSPTCFRARSARSPSPRSASIRASTSATRAALDRAVDLALFSRLLAEPRLATAMAMRGLVLRCVAEHRALAEPAGARRCCAKAAGSRSTALRAAKTSRSPTSRRRSPSACRRVELNRDAAAGARAALRRGRQGRRAFHRAADDARPAGVDQSHAAFRRARRRGSSPATR